MAKTICVEIIGDNQATAEGLTVKGRAPILKLCRELVAKGYDPAAALEAYRGSTLCLKVSSIAKGAGLDILDLPSSGPPRIVRFNPISDGRDFVRVSPETTKRARA